MNEICTDTYCFKGLEYNEISSKISEYLRDNGLQLILVKTTEAFEYKNLVCVPVEFKDSFGEKGADLFIFRVTEDGGKFIPESASFESF